MTLTPARIAAGWKRHDGGDCPVPADSRPKVMIRSGDILLGDFTAGTLGWENDPNRKVAGDIIAYLPEKTDDADDKG